MVQMKDMLKGNMLMEHVTLQKCIMSDTIERDHGMDVSTMLAVANKNEL
jgi:hypothetical protein